jgi:3-hydroxybutyryl-CoA dehydrogenase
MSSGGRDAILARIRGTTENVALNSADFVIEAAAENYDLKAKILKQVDSLVRPEAIIASNSSSVSITRAFSGLTESAGFSLCWICDSTLVSNRRGGCDGQAIFSGLA